MLRLMEVRVMLGNDGEFLDRRIIAILDESALSFDELKELLKDVDPLEFKEGFDPANPMEFVRFNTAKEFLPARNSSIDLGETDGD
jgi:hypothetical protein